jgi:gamma-glutamylcyclotransferase (GGCT)/AIG2-like uncharacterized protein YtfP
MEPGASPRPPLFVYGTLLFSEITERVLGRLPQVDRAAAPSWSTRILTERTYPGLVPDKMAAAGGLLFMDLSDAEWALLDAYEGDEYERTTLTVVSQSGQPTEAEIYLLLDESIVTEDRWTTQWFADLHLADFLARLDRGEPV